MKNLINFKKKVEEFEKDKKEREENEDKRLASKSKK